MNDAMNKEELSGWEKGQEQLLNELWYVIDLLERSCNDTGYGRAQRRILACVTEMMTTGECTTKILPKAEKS